METLLKKKGVEKYRVSNDTVEFNFDAEHTSKTPYIYFLKTAKAIAPNWKYEYKQQRIYITIKLTENNSMYSDNSFIYQIISFMENL